MKKIFLSIVLFLVSPFIVQAIDYDITNYSIRAYIEENGDVKVQEIMVLDGEFNGYERDLDYSPILSDNYESSTIYQGSNIVDVTIKAKYINKHDDSLFSDNTFTSFNKVNYAVSGDIGKYIETKLNNGYRYRMYYRADDQKVAFYLEYTIKDLVAVHSDVAEIYFPFIGDGFEDDLRNVDIKVYLPRSSSSEYYRIWAHGTLAGEVERIGNEGLHAYVKRVDAGEVVDIRMTFDKELVPMAQKKDLTINFEDILEVEAKRKEDADNQRVELLRIYNFVKYGTISLYAILICAWVFIYLKYGKSPKSGYFSKYNREFIDEYNVEVIDYLMNRKITPNAMSASIMNLIYKKNISAKEIVANEKSKKKDYEFTLENLDNINESEKILIEFLFDKVGKNPSDTKNKKTFTTMDLKKYANGTKTCSTFISSYTKWKNNVVADANNEHFFVKSGKPIVVATIIFIIAVLLFMFGVSHGVDFIPTYLMLFFVIIFLFYCMLVYKKTEKGSLHYDKWKAFKNFLNDFGAFELKELPEIALWEKYLVYATVFGLADKVQKAMNVRINELNVDAMGYDYYPSYVYFNLGNSINASVNNAINSAYSRQAANYANSHSSSSSSGFGGGFSGGSGFSGGGGGRGF